MFVKKVLFYIYNTTTFYMCIKIVFFIKLWHIYFQRENCMITTWHLYGYIIANSSIAYKQMWDFIKNVLILS